MPSLAMYLAIAKKYTEQHPEEDEEEFFKGAIAPDMKPLSPNNQAQYGENSHRPELNKYYHTEGLNNSYNRGYFLRLLTDYLFYNRFLNEYSADIYDDYKKMNSRIISKYGLSLPEDIDSRIDIVDGELKSVNEIEVYKFIDTVAELDLESYQTQLKQQDDEHKIKLIGLKEGLLFKQNAPTILNQHSETYLYGYENNYGVLIKRKIGFSETEGAREGLYQVTPIGIAVKPSKIGEFDAGDIAIIRESLNIEELKKIVTECESSLGRTIQRNIGFNFQEMDKEDIKVILRTIKGLPQRTPKKSVTDPSLNLDLVKQDEIEIV